MGIPMNIIVAIDSYNGIGKNGSLPWNLSKDLIRFGKLTTKTTDKNKRNVVLMGRKVWQSIPEKFRPLKNRLNVVLSMTMEPFENIIVARSFESAIDTIQKMDDIETIWNIGGIEVYRKGLESNLLDKLFITFVDGNFNADTFFPTIDFRSFSRENYPEDPSNDQEENGIKFRFAVYKKN
ncbi:unnamed protein product [Dracunculus medinensis]|uniref:dihydrofolate reductase n=1 Tax=Dracunculus medinensis TaxID=318479 RepID=A0A0N4UN52_DRAME|nr:unnamed protein product [Dracunculus medinensis]